jgi:hypothetical protein
MPRHAAGLNALYNEYKYMFWRTGRRVGQCVHAQVYDDPSEDDILLFEAPSPDIASHIVSVHNADLEVQE